MSENEPSRSSTDAWEISVTIRRIDAAHPPQGTPWPASSVAYSVTLREPDGITRSGGGGHGKLSEAIKMAKALLSRWDPEDRASQGESSTDE